MIFRKGDSVDINDGSSAEQTLHWGATTASQPDTGRVVHAHWDGRRLNALVPMGRGGFRSVTYETSPDGKGLTVIMRMQRPDGGEAITLTSRYTKFDGSEP
jgi:hypothetical protein